MSLCPQHSVPAAPLHANSVECVWGEEGRGGEEGREDL